MLHINGSETDIPAGVTKRKIASGTVSTAGSTARDVMLGLTKASSKLKVSFFRYVCDRLGHPQGASTIPPFPDFVCQPTTTADCL